MKTLIPTQTLVDRQVDIEEMIAAVICDHEYEYEEDRPHEEIAGTLGRVIYQALFERLQVIAPDVLPVQLGIEMYEEVRGQVHASLTRDEILAIQAVWEEENEDDTCASFERVPVLMSLDDGRPTPF